MESLEQELHDKGKIPIIGFGTWQLSQTEARESVEEAIKIGYRHIDTAKIYGNEREVGEAIKDSGVPRQDIFLTTKLYRGDLGYESALTAIDESLEKLSQDYVDLYLIHWPGNNVKDREESWRALIEIKKQGKAKHIGVSNFTVKHLKDLAAKFDEKPSVNQIEFHPFIYKEQKALLDYCLHQQIVFEAYSPLARGQHDNRLLKDIGDKYKKSAAQVMIRWAIQHQTVPLPRSANPEHIKENFAVFDFELSDDVMEAIDSLDQTGRTAWDPTNLP